MEKINEIRHRFALLIGVADYNDYPNYRAIPNTVNDVTALEETLKGYNYTVRTLHSQKEEPKEKPTRANILGELNNIANLTGPGDLLLVHFGGHGVLNENKNAYLIPEDARHAALPETAISLDKFKTVMEAAGAQVSILILDACHSGIGRDVDGMSEEFERQVFLEAQGMAVLSSCTKGEMSWEHNKDDHGAFTYYLLEGLRGAAPQKSKRFITFDDLKDYVTNEVRSWAIREGCSQTPSYRAWLVGTPALVELPQSLPTPPPASMSPNPFTATVAIREPERFIGRESEKQKLLTLLTGGSSVAIEGEPKIGKSSLLWHLKNSWQGRVIGPINCMDLEDPEDFFQQIAGALELEDPNWRAIRKVLYDRQLLFLIDELDVAPERDITQNQLNRFRPIIEKNPGFKMVAVSRNPLKKVFPDSGWGSPFYNLLQPLDPLGPLTRDEALMVLAHPWEPKAKPFDDHARERLLDISARHPFKLQKAAFHFYQSLEDPSYDWEAAFHRDMERLL